MQTMSKLPSDKVLLVRHLSSTTL